MRMFFAQYCRIERMAGGVGCTDKAFVKAALSLLSPEGRGRSARSARHEWLRSGLEMKRKAREVLL